MPTDDNHVNEPVNLPEDSKAPFEANLEGQAIDYRQLLAQIQQGNFEAFDQLFNSFYPKLTAYARRYVQSEDLAQDVSQEVFLKLIIRPPETIYNDNLAPWLYRVTRNLAIDKKRRRAFEVTCDDTLIPDIMDESDPLQALIRSSNASIINDIIAKLPETLACVVTMRIFQDVPFKDIASRLNIPVGTALWRMHYALKLLRGYWDEYVRSEN